MLTRQPRQETPLLAITYRRRCLSCVRPAAARTCRAALRSGPDGTFSRVDSTAFSSLYAVRHACSDLNTMPSIAAISASERSECSRLSSHRCNARNRLRSTLVWSISSAAASMTGTGFELISCSGRVNVSRQLRGGLARPWPVGQGLSAGTTRGGLGAKSVPRNLEPGSCQVRPSVARSR